MADEIIDGEGIAEGIPPPPPPPEIQTERELAEALAENGVFKGYFGTEAAGYAPRIARALFSGLPQDTAISLKSADIANAAVTRNTFEQLLGSQTGRVYTILRQLVEKAEVIPSSGKTEFLEAKRHQFFDHFYNNFSLIFDGTDDKRFVQYYEATTDNQRQQALAPEVDSAGIIHGSQNLARAWLQQGSMFTVPITDIRNSLEILLDGVDDEAISISQEKLQELLAQAQQDSSQLRKTHSLTNVSYTMAAGKLLAEALVTDSAEVAETLRANARTQVERRLLLADPTLFPPDMFVGNAYNYSINPARFDLFYEVLGSGEQEFYDLTLNPNNFAAAEALKKEGIEWPGLEAYTEELQKRYAILRQDIKAHTPVQLPPLMLTQAGARRIQEGLNNEAALLESGNHPLGENAREILLQKLLTDNLVMPDSLDFFPGQNHMMNRASIGDEADQERINVYYDTAGTIPNITQQHYEEAVKNLPEIRTPAIAITHTEDFKGRKAILEALNHAIKHHRDLQDEGAPRLLGHTGYVVGQLPEKGVTLPADALSDLLNHMAEAVKQANHPLPEGEALDNLLETMFEVQLFKRAEYQNETERTDAVERSRSRLYQSIENNDDIPQFATLVDVETPEELEIDELRGRVGRLIRERSEEYPELKSIFEEDDDLYELEAEAIKEKLDPFIEQNREALPELETLFEPEPVYTLNQEKADALFEALQGDDPLAYRALLWQEPVQVEEEKEETKSEDKKAVKEGKTGLGSVGVWAPLAIAAIGGAAYVAGNNSTPNPEEEAKKPLAEKKSTFLPDFLKFAGVAALVGGLIWTAKILFSNRNPGREV